jgi:hypothetical protein
LTIIIKYQSANIKLGLIKKVFGVSRRAPFLNPPFESSDFQEANTHNEIMDSALTANTPKNVCQQK